ncbi:hypothetical protein UY3_02750 [Chelonia mydas]|uniref:Uncharacterized protein n=1 Tax=Chelonia mydas TaxID=8469 RepID=M7BW00_CHEMY|nr:hypothetical protein UY3_02750 [Chelonia mydas]
MDTSVGLQTVDSGLNPKDDVMEEEVKLEDDVEHTAGSSDGVIQGFGSVITYANRYVKANIYKKNLTDKQPKTAFKRLPIICSDGFKAATEQEETMKAEWKRNRAHTLVAHHQIQGFGSVFTYANWIVLDSTSGPIEDEEHMNKRILLWALNDLQMILDD